MSVSCRSLSPSFGIENTGEKNGHDSAMGTYMSKRKDGRGMVHNWPDNILLCKIRNSVLPLCICTLGLLSINHFRLTENQFSKMFSGDNPGQIFQKSSAISKTSSNENRLISMTSPEGDDGSKRLVRRAGFKWKE